MKKILFFFLLCPAILYGCHPYGLFRNENLNRQLEHFIVDNTSGGEKPYFQVLLGLNKKGMKVDFVATNKYLSGPLYFYEPIDAVYLGSYVSHGCILDVYGCEGDCFDNRLYNKTLSKRKDDSMLRQLSKTISVVSSYQLCDDGTVYSIPSQKGCSYSYYFLSESGYSDNSSLLIMNNYTKEYMMLIPETYTMGLWREDEFGRIEFMPNRFFQYSTFKNEMVEFPIASMADVKNANSLEALFAQVMINYNDSLVFRDKEGECIKWVMINDEYVNTLFNSLNSPIVPLFISR